MLITLLTTALLSGRLPGSMPNISLLTGGLGRTPPTAPPLGEGEQGQRLQPPPSAPPAPEDSFRFSVTQDDGSPVTFSPCRPIEYVVRTANAPAGSEEMVAAGFVRLSQATGLRFVPVGTTDEPLTGKRAAYQPERYGDKWAPILVAWATPAEVPEIGVTIAGEAGPQQVVSRRGKPALVTGVVHLDPALLRQGRTAEARAVLLHELAHLVGLAHVPRPGALMYPKNTSGVLDYTPADLAGLAALGSGPCRPDI